MKTYGLILADNGSNWFFQGTTDRRWTYKMVDQLKQIPAGEFQAVDESCLIVNRNSGQARQPGTASISAPAERNPSRGQRLRSTVRRRRSRSATAMSPTGSSGLLVRR